MEDPPEEVKTPISPSISPVRVQAVAESSSPGAVDGADTGSATVGVGSSDSGLLRDDQDDIGDDENAAKQLNDRSVSSNSATATALTATPLVCRVKRATSTGSEDFDDSEAAAEPANDRDTDAPVVHRIKRVKRAASAASEDMLSSSSEEEGSMQAVVSQKARMKSC